MSSPTVVGTAKQKLCKKTNRPIVGLVSTDRSVVAALLSTTPRPVTKSSANDLAPQHCTWLFLIRYAALFRVTKYPLLGLFKQPEAA
jgi:hypothetical protein